MVYKLQQIIRIFYDIFTLLFPFLRNPLRSIVPSYFT